MPKGMLFGWKLVFNKASYDCIFVITFLEFSINFKKYALKVNSHSILKYFGPFYKSQSSVSIHHYPPTKSIKN